MSVPYDYATAEAKRKREDKERTERYEHLLKVGWSLIHHRELGIDVIVRASLAKHLFDSHKLSTMHHPCETREEIEAKCGGYCKECGGIISLNWHEDLNKTLSDLQVCHNCSFWMARLKESGPNVVVANNIRYSIGREPGSGENKSFLGFGGAKHEIEFKDGRVVISHNLWYNGEVPVHFRDRIPNNARFIMRQDIQCKNCKETFNLVLDCHGYNEWKHNKKHIQQAMPELNEGTRELLVSQTCGPCFDKLFGDVCDSCSEHAGEDIKPCEGCNGKYCPACFGTKGEERCEGCDEASRERYDY